jgi:hypothetical protein
MKPLRVLNLMLWGCSGFLVIAWKTNDAVCVLLRIKIVVCLIGQLVKAIF